MDPSLLNTFFQYENDLASNCNSLPDGFLSFLKNLIYQSEIQNKYSKPIMWIGIYIAVASLFCILPMVADLLQGFRMKKLWFPCKYFTLNAASLTVIAVAMKLPMDLNNSMPYDVDQAAKLGSMAFMCTMMANLLPSLATMDNKELVTNIIALGVLVITLVVNVCIQMVTGVVCNYEGDDYGILTYNSWSIAIIYLVMLLVLLMIHICSALMILKSKHILETKYKACHETTLKDIELQQPRGLTVDKLQQHVSNHWIMAGTGSPQFMIACSATTSASGVISVSSTVLHVIIMSFTRPQMKFYGSDYKWSVLAIFITQFIGSIIGTIAPLSRCFASLSFKVSIQWICNHIKVFKVESYYTQKLSDWKHSQLSFKFSSRRYTIVIQELKVLGLNLCIGIQKTVVIACKMIALIPIFGVIGILCYLHCLKKVKVMFPAQLQPNNDLNQYVLQLHDDMELAERTLKSISKSLTHLIEKAKKKQPTNLMKLLNDSSGFEGVRKYNMHQVPPLYEEKYVDCWSLTIVTLTTIAISLPNIQKTMIERLVRSVREGLTYVKQVEKTLNTSDEYVSIQKVARRLWLEVEVYRKWQGKNLQNSSQSFNTTRDVVQWFSDTAKNMVTGMESENMKGLDDSSVYMSVSANSMYRITHTILVSNRANIDQLSQTEMFAQLSSMISHILAACLTNLPQVIAMKCHTNVIEKREMGVHVAAILLGETMQIINNLQERELPSLKRDELPFIDKWRDCFTYSFP